MRNQLTPKETTHYAEMNRQCDYIVAERLQSAIVQRRMNSSVLDYPLFLERNLYRFFTV